MAANRVVAFLTPVFAGLAGYVVEWVAKHFPGTPTLDKGQLTAIFIVGASSGAAAALHWVHGWQKHEQRQALDQLGPGVE
jgi:hypothetical protein